MDLQTTEIAQIRPEVVVLPGNAKAGERIRPSCRPREGNDRSQLALFCRCGALPPLTVGLCNSCYWGWRHSLRFFAGRREEVLERDGWRCRACGSSEWIGIHHRKPGDNRPSFLITICAACHAQVHHLLSIWKWIPALVADLWIEQHPGLPVQLQFGLSAQFELNFRGREFTKQILEGSLCGQ
jgi:hypothetical protein